MKSKRRAAADVEARRRTAADLRRTRRALDLSQWDVAERAGCSQSSVAKAERGYPMAPELVRRIAAALLEFDAEAKRRR